MSPPHLEPPDDLVARRHIEPHLAEGNFELRHPPLLGHLGCHLPDPAIVHGAPRVGERQISLHARHVHPEDVRAEVVVPGIEADSDAVSWRTGVAPPEARYDLRGLPVIGAHCDVEEAVVIGHLDHRALGRRHHVVRLNLNQTVDGVSNSPDLLVQAAVDPGRAPGDPKRAQDLAHFSLCGGLRRADLVLRVRRPRTDEAHHED